MDWSASPTTHSSEGGRGSPGRSAPSVREEKSGAPPETSSLTRTYWAWLVSWYSSTSTCQDRKSTRLNSSHVSISYAVFCLKKKSNAAAVASAPTALSFHRCVAPRALHSFPTRRSSDLTTHSSEGGRGSPGRSAPSVREEKSGAPPETSSLTRTYWAWLVSWYSSTSTC